MVMIPEIKSNFILSLKRSTIKPDATTVHKIVAAEEIANGDITTIGVNCMNEIIT